MRYLGAVLVLAFIPSLSAEEKRPPNLIVVFIDDMGWGDFSCFGNDRAETDHVDRLAREGLRFEQFYVNSPICSPSRCALTTGQYPQRWRITSYLNNRQSNVDRGMAQWLDPAAPSLARLLKQGGYATGHFGKWHLGGQRDVGEAPLITEYGFDASLTNFEGLGPRVLATLDAYDGKEPRRHTLGSDRLGKPGEITWVNRDQVTAAFVKGAIDFIDRAEKAGKPFYINLWPDDVHTPLFPPEGRWGDRSKRTKYLAVLETMDEQLGVLFDRVRDSESLRRKTLILVCSDNGPELGAGVAGGFRGHKTHLYEGGVRSPLVVWGPGLIDSKLAGTVNRASVFSAMDLVPTLLAIASVKARPAMPFDGEALPGVLLGRSRRSRQAPLFFRRPPDRNRFYGESNLPDLAVREGKWKLLCEYDGSLPQLYDLDADRGETRNLAESEPEVLARLKKITLEWNAAMPADKGASWKPRPRRRPATR